MSDKTQVEVVYALPQKQTLLRVPFTAGMTARQAIDASGILARYPEIDLAHCKIGSYSRVIPLDESLQGGERIEIYRPLLADPKELRRLRAEQAAKPGK
ncbi:RnfH family protein [Pseudaeromonas sp. ZJS20]|uniref:RnfH family protein n=1 Tax=Pseudaeromonas aegiceratis TaxID=3153928 RepID=UPI00390C81D2